MPLICVALLIKTCADGFLKKFFKYSVTLFILLLIGYSQLFVPIYTGNSLHVSFKSEKDSDQIHAFSFKKSDVEAFYIEEEEEKEDEGIIDCSSTFSYIYVKEYFSLPKRNYSAFYKHFSFASLSGSQYLVNCVFRI